MEAQGIGIKDEKMIFHATPEFRGGLNHFREGYYIIELAKLYSMADLTIIAGKKETFSMVTAESLCC